MERKITALKVQKKNPNRVNVYLDGEFAFGLTRIVAAWLSVGQALTPEKINRLQAEESREAAYNRALLLLSYRPRSENEVRKKLVEKGIEETVADAVIERLKENRYLGDDKFARDWIENRSTFRPRSRKMLYYELRQKGVAEDHIQDALESVEDETELAYQAGVKYARRLMGSDWETFRKRLAAFLGRRGFSYGTIAPTLRRIWSELQTEEQKT